MHRVEHNPLTSFSSFGNPETCDFVLKAEITSLHAHKMILAEHLRYESHVMYVALATCWSVK